MRDSLEDLSLFSIYMFPRVYLLYRVHLEWALQFENNEMKMHFVQIIIQFIHYQHVSGQFDQRVEVEC